MKGECSFNFVGNGVLRYAFIPQFIINMEMQIDQYLMTKYIL